MGLIIYGYKNRFIGRYKGISGVGTSALFLGLLWGYVYMLSRVFLMYVLYVMVLILYVYGYYPYYYPVYYH